jgi:uncharacterized membrane protein YdjX (TVP38/TMEM64 family)
MAAYVSGLHEALSIARLRDHQASLLAYAESHAMVSALSYVAIYALFVALSLPAATVLSLTGGFIFGWAMGAALVVLAATLGASMLFLAARTALGDKLRQRAGPRLDRIMRQFHENSFNYLLFLRLIPLFPFWMVNLAMALLGMRLLPFVLGTALGIVPGSLVFTALGSGLGAAFAAGDEPDPARLLSPTVLIALSGLGLLSLLPVLVRRRRGPADPP